MIYRSYYYTAFSNTYLTFSFYFLCEQWSIKNGEWVYWIQISFINMHTDWKSKNGKFEVNMHIIFLFSFVLLGADIFGREE